MLRTPATPALDADITWLVDRFTVARDTFREAERRGVDAAGRRFLIASARLITALWVERLVGGRPCYTWPWLMRMSWRAFDRTHDALVAKGVLTRLRSFLVAP